MGLRLTGIALMTVLDTALLRHVAMCCDRYLHNDETQPLRFSRAL